MCVNMPARLHAVKPFSQLYLRIWEQWEIVQVETETHVGSTLLSFCFFRIKADIVSCIFVSQPIPAASCNQIRNDSNLLHRRNTESITTFIIITQLRTIYYVCVLPQTPTLFIHVSYSRQVQRQMQRKIKKWINDSVKTQFNQRSEVRLGHRPLKQQVCSPVHMSSDNHCINALSSFNFA